MGLACGLISEWALSVLQTPEDQRDEQPIPNIDHLLSNIGRTAPLGDASGESSYSLLDSFAASGALPLKFFNFVDIYLFSKLCVLYSTSFIFPLCCNLTINSSLPTSSLFLFLSLFGASLNSDPSRASGANSAVGAGFTPNTVFVCLGCLKDLQRPVVMHNKPFS